MIFGKGRHSFVFLFFLAFCTGALVQGQNYVFARLNGSPLNTTGWNLQGNGPRRPM